MISALPQFRARPMAVHGQEAETVSSMIPQSVSRTETRPLSSEAFVIRADPCLTRYALFVHQTRRRAPALRTGTLVEIDDIACEWQIWI